MYFVDLCMLNVYFMILMSYDICFLICVVVGVLFVLRVLLNLFLLYVLRMYNFLDGCGWKNFVFKEKVMVEFIDVVSFSFICFFCVFLY